MSGRQTAGAVRAMATAASASPAASPAAASPGHAPSRRSPRPRSRARPRRLPAACAGRAEPCPRRGPPALRRGLPGPSRLERLAVRDRAFARLLVTTSLRRLGQIDRAVLPLMRYRPKSHSVTNMLRLGAAQLLFLSTPAHAAVAETVRLAQASHAREVPLLNAVLRRVSSEGKSLLEGQEPARLNTPRWLLESWTAAYGEATALAIAERTRPSPRSTSGQARSGTLGHRAGGRAPRHRHAPPPCGRPDRGPSRLRGRCVVGPGCRRRPSGPPHGPAPAAAASSTSALPRRQDRPALRGRSNVTAVERSPRRAEFLAGNLARLNLRAEIVVADANEWQPPEPFDPVLLDAPCTATGTIRRHPDIPWAK